MSSWNHHNNPFVAAALCMAVLLLPYLCYRSFILPLQFPKEYSESLFLGMTAAYLCIFLVLVLVVRQLPEKCLVILSFVLIACATASQLYIADQMQLLPDVDLYCVIDQDKEIVEKGLHYFTNEEYFAVNTNNIPLTIVIYWVFRFTKALGFHNYELAGGIFNVGMNLITYAAGYGIARRVTSDRPAFLFLAALLTNPVPYAYASYYYTDTISMGLATLAVYLFVCAIQTAEKSGKRSIVLFVLSGVIFFWAVKVRVTSSFVLIAAVVYAVIMGKWKRIRKTSIPVMLGLLIGCAVYLPLYHYHVPYDTKETDITWEHFAAMGANMETYGRYSYDDVAETLAQPTHEARVSYNLRKWQRRLKENGLAGGFHLVCNKEAIVWSYGSKQYYLYLQFVKDKQPIYDWLEGEHAGYFRNYLQSYNSLFLTAILVSLLVSLRRKKCGAMTCIAAIDWLGAVAFYAIWEVHPRHSVSYLLLMNMLLIPLFEAAAGRGVCGIEATGK